MEFRDDLEVYAPAVPADAGSAAQASRKSNISLSVPLRGLGQYGAVSLRPPSHVHILDLPEDGCHACAGGL